MEIIKKWWNLKGKIQRHFDPQSILEKGITLKFTETNLFLIKINYFDIYSFFKLRFTPCKTEQPLQGMELQEKEAQKD